MKDEDKSREQLLKELTEMRQQVARIASEEFQKNGDYLEYVFENSPDAIGIVDRHGRLRKWNRMAAEIYGYSFEELKGKKVFDLYEDREKLNRMLVQLRTDGMVKKYPIDMKKKDGSTIPVELSLSLLRDDDRNTIGSVCVARDLSDITKAFAALQATNEQLNREIAVRRRTEEELRVTRDCLENVFEHSPDVIGIVDRRGRFLKWNRMATELYGYTLREVRRMKAFDLYADQEELNELLTELRHEGVVKKCPVQMRRKDGAIIPLEVSISLLKDQENNVTGSVCVARDLSGIKKTLAALREANERLNLEAAERIRAEAALKQAYENIENEVKVRTAELLQANILLTREIEERRLIDEALRQSEYKYRTLVENLPQKIFLKDKDSVFLSCNANYARDLGISPEEIRGKNDFDFSPPNLAEKYRTDDKRIMESGETEEIEENYFLQGEKFFIHTVKTPVKDESGNITGVLGIFWDITRRRRAEEAFKNLVLNAPIGLFIAQNGLFKQVNPEFQKITGYSEQELIDNDCLCLVMPDFKRRVKEKTVQILKGRSYLPFEFQYRTKEGYSRWALEKVSTTQYEGERAILGYFMDITSSKHLEVQFLQAQKMEAVGRLAGGVAHDFNNLLSAILGISDMILLDLPAEEPMCHYVRDIIKTAERAALLTRQLLAFGRKQKVQPRNINLNEVVSGLEMMLRRLLGEDLQLLTRLDEHLAAVRADAGQMEQVIVNLAVNARDAMPQGGCLTLETANVLVDEAYAQEHLGVSAGPYVMLAVSDTGCGMDTNTISRIFEPFFTTKDPGKGTGLGLSTVYGIVQQSQGSIWVYSEPERGTTIKIYLPQVAEAAESIGQTAIPATSLSGSETILVVEDEEELRQVICQICRTYGYNVLEARHGDEAINIWESHAAPIHLVLTDVVLPGMNGNELIARLHLLGRKPKVLFMSGYTEDSAALHGLLEAEAPFLEKPFRPTALMGKVREVLDRPT